jgi:leucyl-tRNA synthetase
MKTYDHKKIEAKWQRIWEEKDANVVADNVKDRENFYTLVEFAYPSGNLHLGHWYAFSIPDIYSRVKKMQGHNVLFPFGYDAFGLPAENAALKHEMNPRKWTYENIDKMRAQLRTMGAMFDWSREIVTCDPAYYKWTQWLFLQFFKKDLAYHGETSVHWCPSCKTVLANEQVVQGKCERCETDVVQKKLKQWRLRITNYADKLLEGLEKLDWPEEIKESQRNWIGKSDGAEIIFKVKEQETGINVFTTRPDTLFGATYMVLAPEHQLVQQLQNQLNNREEIQEYLNQAQRKTEIERQEQKEKTGVALQGIMALNPANNKEIPVWIADYVLPSYGTGAIMAVPAHDDRDWEFAKKFHLPIVEVIGGGDVENAAYTDNKNGVVINSGPFNGHHPPEAIAAITVWLEENNLGKKSTNYRMRDWIVSRQRYWGCPIPIIHCGKCGVVPVPEDQLPVELPELDDFKPRDDGKSPLAKAEAWVKTRCPECAREAKRESDTFDTFIDSSWYFLRYCDPQNDKTFAAGERLRHWMPVDFYSGGAEHTTMHLLYSRFWIKAMYDLGLVDWDEPYAIRKNRGLILGPDGHKMSKRRGNVIDPDEYVARLGADTVRMYLAFIGPYSEVGAYPWDMQGIQGIRKFLQRVWNLQEKVKSDIDDDSWAIKLLHQTIKKVTEDIDKLKFNTAISQMMILVNFLEKQSEVSRGTFEKLTLIISPFVPHLAEEIWEASGHQESIFSEPWVEFDEISAKEDEIEFVVQVNGKVRDKMIVAADITEVDARQLALSSDKVKVYLAGKEPRKVIFIPGRLVNIVL